MQRVPLHNGDFEFFQIGGEWYDVSAVQLWLERATGVRMPSVGLALPGVRLLTWTDCHTDCHQLVC
jgi:hypothetical protein